MTKARIARKDRLIKQKSNDVYMDRSKIPEQSCCTTCGALYLKGRWTWKKPAENVHPVICPACRRIADNYPAGIIELKGSFYQEHHEEVMNLIYNTEKQEKSTHALERIINARDTRDMTIVTTTGIHLARRIGEALSRSYKGEYCFQYLDADKGIRVSWKR